MGSRQGVKVGCTRVQERRGEGVGFWEYFHDIALIIGGELDVGYERKKGVKEVKASRLLA